METIQFAIVLSVMVTDITVDEEVIILCTRGTAVLHVVEMVKDLSIDNTATIIGKMRMNLQIYIE